MYYILSTIVCSLSLTYPINLKSETMHKITLKGYQGDKKRYFENTGNTEKDILAFNNELGRYITQKQ